MAVGFGGPLLVGCGSEDDAEGGSDAETGPINIADASGEVVWVCQELNGREAYWEDVGFNPDITLTRSFYTDLNAASQSLAAGSIDFDMFEGFGNTDFVRKEGLIAPIDITALPNWTQMVPYFQDLELLRNENDEVDVAPFLWGTDAICFNAAEVDPASASSWASIFEGEYAGRTALRDDAQESLAVVGILLGAADPWNMTTAELAEARSYLLANKGNIRTLWTALSDLEAAMVTGDVVLAHAWRPVVGSLREQGIDAQWSSVQEGDIGFVNGVQLSATSSNLDATYAAMNHIIGPEFAKAMYDDQDNVTPSSVLSTYSAEDDPRMRGGDDEIAARLAKLSLFTTTRNIEAYQEVWTEFRSA